MCINNDNKTGREDDLGSFLSAPDLRGITIKTQLSIYIFFFHRSPIPIFKIIIPLILLFLLIDHC